jgi:hypothetical protein
MPSGPSGYDQIYTSLLPKLKNCDIVKQAERLNLRPEGDGAVAEFLGRRYKITNSGVDVIDGGKPVHINNRSLLIYYILSEGGNEPKFSFVPVNRLTGMIDGRNVQDGGWFIGRDLLRESKGSYAAFAAAAQKMGGEYIGKLGGGECWQFIILPKIPVRLLFFEADQEFPAELQFQFDETAPYYMDFECLAFLSGSVLYELERIIKEQ